MRIVVAQSSALVRAGMAALLREQGHEVVGESGRAESVPALVADRAPDVVVLDAGLPPTFTDEGLRAALILRERHAAVGVVVLTRSTGSVPNAAPAEVAVLLPARLDDAGAFAAALGHVTGGGLVIEPAAHDVPATPPGSALEGLTPRERDVLGLMARGLSNRGIADRLNLTTNTVGTHIQHVFDKLGVPDSRAENRRVLAVLTYLDG